MINLKIVDIRGVRGYSKKAPSILPEGVHQIVNDFDVRKRSLVKTKGLCTPELNGVDYASTGLTTLNEFFKFRTGRPSPDDVKYIARDDQKIMLWNPSTPGWSQIDAALSNTLSSSRFVLRNGVLIIPTGNGSSNQPEWYGYVPSRFPYAYNGTGITATETTAGFSIANANISTPNKTMFAVHNFWSAAWSGCIDGSLTAGRYYKISVQYDGYAWSAPSDYYYQTHGSSASHNTNKVVFTFAPATDSSRISGVRVYASDDNETYYRIAEVLHNDRHQSTDTYLWATETIFDGTYNNSTGLITANTARNWVADEFNDCVVLWDWDTDPYVHAHRILDTTMTGNGEISIGAGLGYSGTLKCWIVSSWSYASSNYKYAVFDNHPSLESLPEMWDDLEYYDGEVITANYKYAAHGGGRMFIAGVYKDGETYNSRVYFSHVDTNGISQYDVFRDADYIDVGTYGINNIKGIIFNSQRLTVFGEHGIVVLNTSAGSIFTWRLSKLVQSVGVVSDKSIMHVPDGKFAGGYAFLAYDGPRVLYNGYSYPLAEDIIDDDDFPLDVTTMSECVTGYDPANQHLMFTFDTDNVIFCYSMLTDSWVKKTISAGYFGFDDDDNAMLSENTNLKSLSGSDYSGMSVQPVFKSKVFTFPVLVLLQKISIAYKSDTVVNLDIFLDRANSPNISKELGVNNDLNKPATSKLPYGKWCKEFSVQLSIGSTYLTNTVFEIESITIYYTPSSSDGY